MRFIPKILNKKQDKTVKQRVKEALTKSNTALSLWNISRKIGSNFKSVNKAIKKLMKEGLVAEVSTSAGKFYLIDSHDRKAIKFLDGEAK